MTGYPPQDWRKVRRRLRRREAWRRMLALARRPLMVAVIVVLAAGGAVAGITAGPASRGISAGCQKVFVPAYFGTGTWTQAINSKPAPSALILNPATGVGAGRAPNRAYQSVVRQARAAGSAVLGYSSTADGLRPVAQVEADVRNYHAWYGVTGIFLDRVNGVSSKLSYYEQLAGYIHRAIPGSSVWLNAGIYPERQYMSVGDVLMVFEGTFTQYRDIVVPGWARGFPADRFASTIYGASSSSQANDAIRLSRSRNVGYIYVTNLTGSNPYDALPGYWSSEDAALRAGCRAH